MKLTNEAGFALLLGVIAQAQKDLTDPDPRIIAQAKIFLDDVRTEFAHRDAAPRRPRRILRRRKALVFSQENIGVRHEA